MEKIRILERVLQEAKKLTSIQTPEGMLPREDGMHCEFPRSVRQFNLWDSKKGPHFCGLPTLAVSRNSNETLKKYPEHKRRLQSVLKHLVDLSVEVAQRSLRSPVRKLRRQLQESEQLRTILELELIASRERIEVLMAENEELRERHAAMQKEYRVLRERQNNDGTRSRKRTIALVGNE